MVPAIRCLAFLLLAGLVMAPHPTIAQVGGPMLQTTPSRTAQPTEAADPAELREFLRLLSDPRIVAELRQQLEAVEAPDKGVSMRMHISEAAARIEARVNTLISSFSKIEEVPSAIIRAWIAGVKPGDGLRGLTYVLVFLFIGGGLEWLYRQYARSLQLRLAYNHGDTLGRRFANALGGAALHLTGLAIFTGGSIGAFLLFRWPELTREFVINLLITVITFRLVGAVVRFVLAPGMPALRLVPLGNVRARRATRYVMLAAFVGIFGMMLTDSIAWLGEATNRAAELAAAREVVPVIAAIVFAVILVAMNLRLRRSRSRASSTRSARDRTMVILNTVMILVVLVLWLVGARALVWTMIILGLLYPAIRALSAVVDNFYKQAEATTEEDRQAQSSTEAGATGSAMSMAEDAPPPAAAGGDAPVNEAEPFAIQRLVVKRFVRIGLVLAAIAVIAWVWGLGFLSLSGSPSTAGRLFRTAVNVLVTLLIADLVWTWAKTAIDRRLADYGPVADGMAPGPEARMATLLPIFRMFLMITVVVIVSLTVLSSIGIDIGPLLAGAGVAGIAIGFGAQALVRDVVSGIFYLLDDAFRVGEYIEMENLRGTVESMSIRSLRVRHHLGAVHTIPFGELKSLTNYSRDWVIMKLEFRVPFDTDLKLVKKIVKEVGKELQAHEGYGQHLIQPLKSQGVRRMEEFNMVIGVKFMARPGAQWLIRRDAYQKLRDAFEKNGINFAQRNVKVEVSSETPLPDEVRRAVSGAAQEAIEKRDAQPQPVPDEP